MSRTLSTKRGSAASLKVWLRWCSEGATSSRTLSTKRGSADSLKVSLRCGCSENARQMRCTVEIDKPEALAIERVLQWVAAGGIGPQVLVPPSGIFASPLLRWG